MRALVIGRFQPFHKGHLHVITEVAAEADELIIGIAAAADSRKPSNPFSAGERNEMVRLALVDAGVGPFLLIDLPDIHNPPVWARYVMSLTPPFEVVVAHSEETLELFEAEGVQTMRATPYRMGEVSGTRVRELMLSDGPWQDLVPPSVAGYLDSIDGPGVVRQSNGLE